MMTKRPTPATDMRTLSDLTSDPRNANRGTPRGREALRHSLHAFGAGRAVLIDRHGVVIAGNKTVAEARAQGLRLRVIESDGSELIAVQRRDLDLASDDRAQALALADNRVGELDLVWDETTLQELHAAGVELAALWTDEELAERHCQLGLLLTELPHAQLPRIPVSTRHHQPRGVALPSCAAASCREDDGRPVDVGGQEPASTHPKRLS